MPRQLYLKGPLGSVYLYVRPSSRIPAKEFLNDCEEIRRKKLKGLFRALTELGARFQLHQQFKPLHNEGKPLWEFKAFDHRLYAIREQISEMAVNVVLLNGWVKDKEGKAKEERDKIAIAITLYQEYLRYRD